MVSDEQKQAKIWQSKMEAPLLELEKIGALDAEMADEVRNIVAEGIAEKFQERYRVFPGQRNGVQIRRDRVPAECVLRKHFNDHAKAIRENTLPAPIAMAREYGNMQPPSQPREIRNCQVTNAHPRVASKEQSAPKGSWYRKPDAVPETTARSGRNSSPKKPTVARMAAWGDQKTPSSCSRATSPDKVHKHWQGDLTSNTDQTWSNIYDNPYALMNSIHSSSGSRKTRENETVVDLLSASPVSSEMHVAQSGQKLAGKDIAAGLKCLSPTKTTTVATVTAATVTDDVVGRPEEEEKESGGMVSGSEDKGTSVPQTPVLQFGNDLIWLGD